MSINIRSQIFGVCTRILWTFYIATFLIIAIMILITIFIFIEWTSPDIQQCVRLEKGVLSCYYVLGDITGGGVVGRMQGFHIGRRTAEWGIELFPHWTMQGQAIVIRISLWAIAFSMYLIAVLIYYCRKWLGTRCTAFT